MSRTVPPISGCLSPDRHILPARPEAVPRAVIRRSGGMLNNAEADGSAGNNPPMRLKPLPVEFNADDCPVRICFGTGPDRFRKSLVTIDFPVEKLARFHAHNHFSKAPSLQILQHETHQF